MKRILGLLLFFTSCFIGSMAQEVLEISPLFEYKMPPEEMESPQDRCDFIVNNFWDNFDFKKTEAVDQYALNEAFKIYCSAFQFAAKKDVDTALDKLLTKLNGNPTLLFQFCNAAEETLYGPRASFWVDEVYIKFLDALLKNKKIPEKRKKRFELQASALKESMIGQKAPSFKFRDNEGNEKNYFPMSTPTILIFGIPEDTDWRITRIKMESNYKLSEAINKGKLNVLYIIPYDVKEWATSVSNYNNKWTLGQSTDAVPHYDIRLNPSVYVIGSDGKIVSKRLSAEESVARALELIN